MTALRAMTFLFALLSATLTVTLLPATLTAAPLPIEATVPADALLVYFSRPSAEMADPSGGGAIEGIGRWLVTLKTMGLLPQQGRIVADVIGTLPLLTRRPHALVLMDITARKLGPGSYRLNDMKSALVVDQEGIATELDRRVRDLLATYTDAQNGRIEPVEAGGVRYHRLTDARLPAWAVSEWGTVQGYFVVGFGQGAFDAVAAAITGQAPRLGDDPWYAQAHLRCSLRGAGILPASNPQSTRANRGAGILSASDPQANQGAGASAAPGVQDAPPPSEARPPIGAQPPAEPGGIEGYVALAAIEKRLENVMNQMVRTALRAARLDQADRLLMTIGFDGRALHSELLVRDHHGGEYHQILTGKEVVAPEVLAQIPEGADSFAAFRFPLGEAVRRARETYFRTQSAGRRQRFSEGWASLEEQYGFDVETGLLDRLGDHLIFHTFPPHPLKIPLLGTIWIQAHGDRAAITQTVDAMMRAWQTYANAPSTQPARFRLTPQIRHDPDGIWYLQLGLLGPAMAVTDGWIVISFSPEAVRDNLAQLGGNAATRPSQ